MATENLIDKIKLYQRTIKECGLRNVDIEEEKKVISGTRCLITLDDQDTNVENGVNMNFNIKITVRGKKKHWQEVVKYVTSIQKAVKDKFEHQDIIEEFLKIADDSETVYELNVKTAFQHV